MQNASASHSQENTENLPGYHTRWIGLLFIGISLLVISLDNTILNVALPAISTDLGASQSELQWIVDAYVLVFAALLLTMGGLGDRLGRKRFLQFGLVLFGIGSFAAANSTTTEMLIASRAFLGVGGATIMPATLSIISASFPRHERSQAIAIWAAIFGLGVGIGPLVGGWLLEDNSWQAVFYINLPIVAIALIGDHFYLAESRDEHAPRLDLPGILLSIPGLFALIYGIIEAGVDGWTADNVLFAFAAAAVLLGLFAWWENRNPHPMLPIRFFRNMSFTGANLALALIMFSLFGSIFFLSQFLQTVQGFTALEAGLRIFPMALVLAIMSALSSRISARIGTKYTVALGIFIAGSGLLFMSQVFEPNTDYETILLGITVMAGGLGLAVSPATDSIMGSVPVTKAGIGSAMNDTTRQLGGALGIAVLGTIMNDIYLDGVRGLKGDLPPVPPGEAANNLQRVLEGTESSIQGAHYGSEQFVANVSRLGDPRIADAARGIRQTIIDTADTAFTDGMTTAMFVASIVMFSAVFVVLAILPHRVQAPREELSAAPVPEHSAPSAGPLETLDAASD